MDEDRRALFEAWSASYDPAADGEFPFGEYDRVLDRVAELVAARAPARVLELGVGSGNLTRRILERLLGVTVVGVDFSPAMAAPVAELPGVELVAHDLSTLPLPPGTRGCDVAAMSYVLHEFDDVHKLRLLAALLDDLPPHGACVIGDVCFTDAAAREVAHARLAERWDPGEHYVAVAELAAAAAEGGLALAGELLGAHAGVLTVERVASG